MKATKEKKEFISLVCDDKIFFFFMLLHQVINYFIGPLTPDIMKRIPNHKNTNGFSFNRSINRGDYPLSGLGLSVMIAFLRAKICCH